MRKFLMRNFHRPARIDHHPMYVMIIFALGTWSGSLVLFGPTENSVINELSLSTQYLLSGVILIGSALCQTGIFVGTRFTLIGRKADVRTAYALAIGGIPAIAIAVEIYFIAVVLGSVNPFYSALGAAISFAIPIGALWNMLLFIVRRWEIDDYLKGRLKEMRDNDAVDLDNN